MQRFAVKLREASWGEFIKERGVYRRAINGLMGDSSRLYLASPVGNSPPGLALNIVTWLLFGGVIFLGVVVIRVLQFGVHIGASSHVLLQSRYFQNYQSQYHNCLYTIPQYPN